MDIVNEFHQHFYDSGAWGKVRYHGVPTHKNPLDLWIYQEMLHELRPEAIVEAGTYQGGSAFFLAHTLDNLASPASVLVHTIDIADGLSLSHGERDRPVHPRIRYLKGSSTDPAIRAQVHAACAGKRTLVILDSNHDLEHVFAEMVSYADLVPVGGYMIVEDTNVNGHPALPSHGPGPMEAVQRFLASNNQFVVDLSREKFFMTFNPNGFLQRVR